MIKIINSNILPAKAIPDLCITHELNLTKIFPPDRNPIGHVDPGLIPFLLAPLHLIHLIKLVRPDRSFSSSSRLESSWCNSSRPDRSYSSSSRPDGICSSSSRPDLRTLYHRQLWFWTQFSRFSWYSTWFWKWNFHPFRQRSFWKIFWLWNWRPIAILAITKT